VVVTVDDGEADADGGFQVSVNALPPGAPNITAPANQVAVAGTEHAFALGSFLDPGSSGPWQVTVEWGDDSSNTLFNTNTSGVLGAKLHTYAAIGIYDALVTVSDGALSASAAFQVNVSASIDSGSVAGLVFDDTNGNGIQEEDEIGVQGATLTLENSEPEVVAGAITRTSITDATGHYRFDNVPTGSYTLTLMPPSGYLALGASEISLVVQVGETTTPPTFDLQEAHGESTLRLPVVQKP
jgi:hypothetical protein